MKAAEAISKVPNKMALATSIRGGKGAHNTTKHQKRKDRRAGKQENRLLES